MGGKYFKGTRGENALVPLLLVLTYIPTYRLCCVYPIQGALSRLVRIGLFVLTSVALWRILEPPAMQERESMMLLRLRAGECVGSGASHEQQ